MIANLALAFLGLIGLAIPLMLAHSLFREFTFSSQAQRFSGRIVDFASIRAQGTRMYSPVIEWTGPDGKNRRFRGSAWLSWRRYEIGQTVVVLCGFEKDQVRVCMDSFAERFGFGLLMLIFVSFVSAIVLIGLLRA